MFSVPFAYKYPEIAKNETKIFTLLEDKDWFPAWDYVIEEFYCTKPSCHCEIVNFCVTWPDGKTYYLWYWFEKPEYYMKQIFINLEDAKKISWLHISDVFWERSDNLRFLEFMRYILNNKVYVDRLKRHYLLMKQKVEWYEDPEDDFDSIDISLLNDELFFSSDEEIDEEIDENIEYINFIWNKKTTSSNKELEQKKKKEKNRQRNKQKRKQKRK